MASRAALELHDAGRLELQGHTNGGWGDIHACVNVVRAAHLEPMGCEFHCTVMAMRSIGHAENVVQAATTPMFGLRSLGRTLEVNAADSPLVSGSVLVTVFSPSFLEPLREDTSSHGERITVTLSLTRWLKPNGDLAKFDEKLRGSWQRLLESLVKRADG